MSLQDTAIVYGPEFANWVAGRHSFRHDEGRRRGGLESYSEQRSQLADAAPNDDRQLNNCSSSILEI